MAYLLNDWLVAFDAGEFSSSNISVQVRAGWVDWFCSDSLLHKKTATLSSKLRELAKSSKFDSNKVEVYFWNKCPVYGSLFDTIRLVEHESGHALYIITPSCGHIVGRGLSEVWGRENGFAKPLVSGDWRTVRRFFR